MRQNFLSVILVACTILAYGGLVVPERASAQSTSITCPELQYPPVGSIDLRNTSHLTFRWFHGRTDCQLFGIRDSWFLDLAFHPWSEFMMSAVGDGSGNDISLSSDTYGVRINYHGWFNTIYDLVLLSCVTTVERARRVTISTISINLDNKSSYETGEVLLQDGESCQLRARWEYYGNYAEYSGTVRRNGAFYSVDAGSTFDAKGVFVRPDDVVTTWDNVFRDGGTDTRADTTVVGTPKTLVYYVASDGPFVRTFELTDNVFIENDNNVENVSITVDEYTTAAGDPHVGRLAARYKVTMTYTATDPDFGFHIVFPNNRDFIDSEYRLTIGNPTATTNDDDDDDDTVDRTKRIITNFMARRAAQIVGREPDLTKRLADGGQSSNGGPVNVMGSGTATNYNLAFATSLRQVAGSSRAAKRKRIGKTGSMMALGAGGTSSQTGSQAGSQTGSQAGSQTGSQAGSQKGIQRARTSNSLKDEPTAPDREFANRPLTGIGFWTEGTLSKVDDGTSKSDFDLLYVGADYRFSSGLVVGLLAQFDHTEEEDGTNGFAVKGKGWLAGPYVVARLGTNLILDARAAWGRSDNEVSPYNTYADEFKGRRKLLRGRLTGDFKFGALHVAPHIGVVYYEEEQKTYTDSLGNTISSQKVELGRLTFGPKLSTTFTRPDGATVTPHVAVHGIWDFRRTDLVNIDTGLALTGTDDFRARAQAGVTARRADGMAITAEGFYDGIGANGFNAYGGTLRFDVPF
ncbi:MAG: autotransporter outer membrane beta-barrel domain-containing protein [Pseudomonadota bacterium]